MSNNDTRSSKSKMNNRLSQPKPILGQAFGVGVYEEEDEDIYAKDDIGRYDFYLESSHTNKDKNVKRTSRWENNEDQQCLLGFVPEKTASKLNQTIRFPPPQLP